jgi:hypothetical protein
MEKIKNIVTEINKKVVGQDQLIRDLLVCLLCK